MGKEMVRNIIRETLEEKMNKIREQWQQWKTPLRLQNISK